MTACSMDIPIVEKSDFKDRCLFANVLKDFSNLGVVLISKLIEECFSGFRGYCTRLDKLHFPQSLTNALGKVFLL